MDNTVKVFGFTIRSQARRRQLVCALYVSYAFILAPFWLAHAYRRELLAIAVPAFLIWAACFWSLSQVTRAYVYSKMPERNGDERQVQVRDRAFARAYQILSAVFCLTMLYGILAQDFGWWMPAENERQAVLFGMILLSATLPSAVVAWMEKDDPEDIPSDFKLGRARS